ncbi:type II toxin-antitoxin system RelE family toxin [Longimicrobium sp.]|uniref:type II toxin-antitoxin system RelE family toxin n=1 Tax=Longimicrobium sp. TaxID=2029185 RepID=UPI003B3A484A
MKTEFTPAFLRDLRKLPDAVVGEQVRNAILTVEQAVDLRSVPNLKKMTGVGPYYRIRTGEYRIGLRVEEQTVVFIRVLPRGDIYRYFP